MSEGVLIRFRLIGREAQALRRLSADELRNPRDQVKHVLLRELMQRGLLPTEEKEEGDDAQR